MAASSTCERHVQNYSFLANLLSFPGILISAAATMIALRLFDLSSDPAAWIAVFMSSWLLKPLLTLTLMQCLGSGDGEASGLENALTSQLLGGAGLRVSLALAACVAWQSLMERRA
jgi:hypothetical protein